MNVQPLISLNTWLKKQHLASVDRKARNSRAPTVEVAECHSAPSTSALVVSLFVSRQGCRSARKIV